MSLHLPLLRKSNRTTRTVFSKTLASVVLSNKGSRGDTATRVWVQVRTTGVEFRNIGKVVGPRWACSSWHSYLETRSRPGPVMENSSTVTSSSNTSSNFDSSMVVHLYS